MKTPLLFAAVWAALLTSANAAPLVAPQHPQAPQLVHPVLANREADQIAKLLRATEAECARQPEEYRVDCLRYGLWDIRTWVKQQKEYRGSFPPVVQELRALERELKKIVDANADPAAPRIPVRRKKLQAVKKAAVPKVNAAARARIAETQTRLLRSSGAGTRAQVTKVAQALGSTKKILRS